MADITNPLIVNWANSRARTIADKLVQLNYALLGYQQDYASAGIAAALTAAGATGNIVNGSAVDGRTPVVGTDLQNLIAGVNAVLTALATTNIPGVGVPMATIAGKWQVNGAPR